MHEAQEIGRQIWRRYHRDIDAEVLVALTEKRLPSGGFAAANALWLTLALEQLNLLDGDDFARAQREFDGPPVKRMRRLVLDTARNFPPDLPGLYRQQFVHTCRVFGPEPVKAFLAATALGRHGWRESDLQALILRITLALNGDLRAEPLYDINAKVMQTLGSRYEPGRPAEASAKLLPTLLLAGVRRALGFHLVLRNELQWGFAHAMARDAVIAFLEMGPALQTVIHGIIADHLVQQTNDDPVRCDEIAYHLLQAGEYGWIQIFYGSTYATSSREIHATTQTLVDDVLSSGLARLANICNSDVTPMVSGAGDQLPPGFDFFQKDIRRDVTKGWCAKCGEHLLPAIKAAAPVDQLRDLVAMLLARLKDAAHDFPDDLEVQRLTSRLQAMAADQAMQAGAWNDARMLSAKALGGLQQLVEAHADDATLQNDLANGHFLQGDLAVQRGDLAAAALSYGRARDCVEEVSDASAQATAAIALDKLGDVERAQGRRSAARNFYERALPKFRALAVHKNLQRHRRDVFLCLSKLGTVSLEEDALELSGSYFSEAGQIANALAQENPTDPECQRDLARMLGQLGSLAMRTGHTPEAEEELLRAHNILEALAKRDSSNAGWQQDLAGSFYNRAMVAAAAGGGQPDADLLGSASAVLLKLADADRIDAQGRRLLISIATHWQSLTDPAQALAVMRLGLGSVAEESDEHARRALVTQALMMASHLVNGSQNDEAAALVEDLLPASAATFGEISPLNLAALNLHGILRKREGRLLETEPIYRRVYEGFRALEGHESKAARSAHRNLMWVLRRVRAVNEDVAPRPAMPVRRRLLQATGPSVAYFGRA